ncbi:8613_t:CDS:2 [Ambispora leptoticha]|uniref:8613_t:CDS:1 n=1 Tax=Ambispora leptoticha TaxID=144679 RepID=A0A9N8ZK76_9GLOM|nr:8613_t:CDS:2 [Ambispora leptoticha]
MPIFSYATEATTQSQKKLPTPSSNNGNSNTKISDIVDQIASLNLLEAADLVQQLKTRLGIQDIAMSTVNVASSAVSAPAAAAAPKVEEEKPAEKTEFRVKLEKYEATAKTKIIREIKNIIQGMNLVEAKKFVEGVPKVIKESAPKEEAEKIKKTIEDLGGSVVLE